MQSFTDIHIHRLYHEESYLYEYTICGTFSEWCFWCYSGPIAEERVFNSLINSYCETIQYQPTFLNKRHATETGHSIQLEYAGIYAPLAFPPVFDHRIVWIYFLFSVTCLSTPLLNASILINPTILQSKSHIFISLQVITFLLSSPLEYFGGCLQCRIFPMCRNIHPAFILSRPLGHLLVFFFQEKRNLICSTGLLNCIV